jgi:Mor family transcriptional regulator
MEIGNMRKAGVPVDEISKRYGITTLWVYKLLREFDFIT